MILNQNKENNLSDIENSGYYEQNLQSNALRNIFRIRKSEN